MRKSVLLFVVFLICSSSIYSNGVGIIDGNYGIYLKLLSTGINVNVENQIAIVKTTQKFKNKTTKDQKISYAFPMPEGSNATSLNYQIGGTWYKAKIAAKPQDSIYAGSGELIEELKTYLGSQPLNYPVPDTIRAGEEVTFELTYVQLLKYDFGNVRFEYPNDYSLIQGDAVTYCNFEFNLSSQRTIESVQMLSNTPNEKTVGSNSAYLTYSDENLQLKQNIDLVYSLSLNELGLFGFSTFLPDTLVPDSKENGYLVFVAEPDPSENTKAINKIFTLIIDRSGSMSGNKIVQARSAATFIINNLNEGDKFNIVDFSNQISSFRTGHVEYNQQNRDAALTYIDLIEAGGGTDIDGALNEAIGQFGTANDSTANIIIFFTDGEATAGETNTDNILQNVKNLINSSEASLSLFSFGIGDYVNEQLLTLLATNNNGISYFLKNNELESAITNFYLMIRNPVLLNTALTNTPERLTEIYPNPLPNLYKGQQMIVAARYGTPDSVSLDLGGNAFGKNVKYNYGISLSDSSAEKLSFLPKIWAKLKIENLFLQYYSLESYTVEADKIKEAIIKLSLQYGIITDFTSYSGSNPTGVSEESGKSNSINTPETFALLGNYPNPFNPSTKIRFELNKDLSGIVKIRIYNVLGKLIKEIYVPVNGINTYEAEWNGLMENGSPASSGVYIYMVEYENYILSGKMMLLK